MQTPVTPLHPVSSDATTKGTASPSVQTPAPRPQTEMDIRELLKILRRRRWLIAGATLAGVLLMGVTLTQITPKYTATSVLMVDPRQNNVVDLEQVLSGLPANAETVQSEIEVLRSRDLASRVVDTLKLADNPEFAQAENNTSSQPDALHSVTVNTVLEALAVKVAGRSRVISVSFQSENPETASTIANAFADIYLIQQLESRSLATRNASSFLNERLEQLRNEAEQAELAVTQFKASMAQNNGVGQEQSTHTESNALSFARNRLTALHALETQTKPPAQWPEEGLRRAYETLQSLESEKAGLATELGPRHPRMVELNNRLAAARAKYQLTLEQLIKAAEENVNMLSSSAPEREATTLNSRGEAEARLRTLEREAAASRALFETFLTRSKETGEQEGLEQADARLISRASVPTEPSFPNKKLFLLLAALGSMGIGLALAFIMEQLDSGFRSSDQIETYLGLPTIAMVPSLQSLGVKNEKPETYVSTKPNSAFAESIRGLRMSLLLSNVDHPPKVLMLTSALPGEGKTSVTLSLARMAAMGGEKVIVLDADLRRPRVHSALGVENKIGLVEMLSGQATLEQAL